MISSWAPATSGLALGLAGSPDELEAHFAVRHAVFVEAQGLFTGTDRDARDEDALHAIARVDDAIVGAVRLYPLGGGLWKGDRLAVLPEVRVHRLGGLLVQFAVRTAGSAAARAWSRRCRCPTSPSSSASGWARDGERGALRAASCTSRWRFPLSAP